MEMEGFPCRWWWEDRFDGRRVEVVVVIVWRGDASEREGISFSKLGGRGGMFGFDGWKGRGHGAATFETADKDERCNGEERRSDYGAYDGEGGLGY
jgi:hypothetical protein